MKPVTAGANTTVNRFVQPLFTYVYLCFQFYVLCDDLSSFFQRIIRFKKYLDECIAVLDCWLQGLIFGKWHRGGVIIFENLTENICEIELIFEKTYACQSGT